MATTRTRKTVGRAAVGITVVAVVAVGLLGYKAAAGTGNTASDYRTVTAAAGTITQALSLSGTVHHVTQTSVSFPTSGVVTAVNVKAGDPVTAGEALASIDATPLQNAVLADNATYTAAIAQYQTDEQAYASSSTTTSGTTTVAAKAENSAASTSAQAASGTSSSRSASSSPSATSTPSGGSTSATATPSGGSTSAATDPAAAVTAATDAISALQTGVQTVETTLPIFIAQCIPLIPTTAASPEATVTKTVTATATVTHTATVTATATVTVKPEAPAGSVTANTAASSAAPTATTTATSTTPKTSASSTATSKANSSSTGNSTASTPITAACQAAMDTLKLSNTTLPDQMTAANVALTAAVKALDAQAASLEQQAAALAKAGQTAQSAAASSGAAAARSQSSTLSSTNSALQTAAAAGLSRSGTTGGAVTEATLITDQSAIQADDVALAEAQDQLSAATITSPIAGKVASMPFVVGQEASATASAVVIGSGAIEITDAVPLASRPQVATGETANVTSVVGGTALQGTISRISLLPTITGFSLAAAGATGGGSGSAATSTTTYATVITVATGGDALPEGSRVQTTINTKIVAAAVVVPVSALTPITSGSATLEVLTNGAVSTRRVVTGAVGGTEVQIVSGLSAGATVVIADLTKPIPGASITASRASQSAQAFPNGGNFTAGGAGRGTGGGGSPVGAPAS